jgi:class 3 adenylate cyclase
MMKTYYDIIFYLFILQLLPTLQRYSCDLKLRIGIHTGDAVGSVISLIKPRYLIWGASTIIANHMESSGEAGFVNLSRRVVALIIHLPHTSIESNA